MLHISPVLLIRHDTPLTIRCRLDCKVKRLGNGWKVRPERELVHDVREIHHCDELAPTGTGLTIMMGVFITHVAVAKRCNMEVCRHLFNLYATIDTTCWTTLHFVVCRSIGGVLLLDSAFFPSNKKLADTREGAALIWSSTFG